MTNFPNKQSAVNEGGTSYQKALKKIEVMEDLIKRNNEKKGFIESLKEDIDEQYNAASAMSRCADETLGIQNKEEKKNKKYLDDISCVLKGISSTQADMSTSMMSEYAGVPVKDIIALPEEKIREKLQEQMKKIEESGVINHIIKVDQNNDKVLNRESMYVSKYTDKETHNEKIDVLVKQTADLAYIALDAKRVRSEFQWSIEKIHEVLNSLLAALDYFESDYNRKYRVSIEKRRKDNMSEEKIQKEMQFDNNKKIADFYSSFKNDLQGLFDETYNYFKVETYHDNLLTEAVLEETHMPFEVDKQTMVDALLQDIHVTPYTIKFFERFIAPKPLETKPGMRVFASSKINDKVFGVNKKFFGAKLHQFRNKLAIPGGQNIDEGHIEAVPNKTKEEKDVFIRTIIAVFKQYFPIKPGEELKQYWSRVADTHIRPIADSPKDQLEKSQYWPAVIQVLKGVFFSSSAYGAVVDITPVDREQLLLTGGKIIKNLPVNDPEKKLYLKSFLALYKILHLADIPQNRQVVVDELLEFISSMEPTQLKYLPDAIYFVAGYVEFGQSKGMRERLFAEIKSHIGLYLKPDMASARAMQMMSTSERMTVDHVKLISLMRLMEQLEQFDETTDFMLKVQNMFQILKDLPFNTFTVSQMHFMGTMIKKVWEKKLQKENKTMLAQYEKTPAEDSVLHVVEGIVKNIEENAGEIKKENVSDKDNRSKAVDAVKKMSDDMMRLEKLPLNGKILFSRKENTEKVEYEPIPGSYDFVILLSGLVNDLESIIKQKHELLTNSIHKLDVANDLERPKIAKLKKALDEEFSEEKIAELAKRAITRDQNGRLVYLDAQKQVNTKIDKILGEPHQSTSEPAPQVVKATVLSPQIGNKSGTYKAMEKATVSNVNNGNNGNHTLISPEQPPVSISQETMNAVSSEDVIAQTMDLYASGNQNNLKNTVMQIGGKKSFVQEEIDRLKSSGQIE